MMTLSVSQLQMPVGNTRYLSKGFRNIIENHLDWLRSSNRSSSESIDPHALIKYEGDFYGYLNTLRVKQDKHWIIMRMNYMHNPSTFDESYSSILLPSEEDLSYLLGRYSNTSTTI